MNNKQTKILETSIMLFMQYTPRKTTMDDIANSANVSKVTIYKYFGDKESLYFHVGKCIIDNYLAELNRQVHSDLLTNEKLKSVIQVITKYSVSGEIVLLRSLSQLNKNLDNELVYFYSKYKSAINLLIEEGKKQQIIKNEINNEIIFYYIDMGIEYIQNNSEYRERMINDLKFQAEFINFIISNIFTEKGGVYN